MRSGHRYRSLRIKAFLVILAGSLILVIMGSVTGIILHVYDFILIDEDHHALVVADVSGKGISAALYMTVAKTLIHNVSAAIAEYSKGAPQFDDITMLCLKYNGRRTEGG